MLNIYLLVINMISFTMYGIDKFCAINNLKRISEKALLSVSFIGGSIGSIFGMIIFNHKIKKLKFKVLNVLFLIISTTILYYLKQKGMI